MKKVFFSFEKFISTFWALCGSRGGYREQFAAFSGASLECELFYESYKKLLLTYINLLLTGVR